MSIEMSPAPTEAKAPAASDAKPSKGAKPGAGQPGGFMAIFAAMDATAVAAETDTQSLQTDPLLGIATQMGLLNPAEAKADVAVDATALLAQSMQWSNAELNNADVNRDMNAAANVDGKGGTKSLSFQMADLQPRDFKNAVKPDKTGKAKMDFANGQAQVDASPDTQQNGSQPSPMDLRALLTQQKSENTQAKASNAEAVAPTVAISASREDTVHERAIFKPLVSEPIAPVQAEQSGAPAFNGVSESGVAAAPEVFVAEQVKYWISNDVQNAEMKLDGLGDKPVEVSISMQGNEAHVSFRTDEAKARDALENAGTQLRDMLQREGLVLSGVSVGTSGTKDSAADQERKPRQGVKTASIAAIEPLATHISSHNSRVAGRAVDLFV